MSTHAQLDRIPAGRRRQVADRLCGAVSLRVDPDGVTALVDAAADRLADGQLGAAGDLLRLLCSPSLADELLFELLEPADTESSPRLVGRVA